MEIEIDEAGAIEEESGESSQTVHEESDVHHSEAEPNDHDLPIEELSESNDNKQWYEQLVLTYFEFPELLKKKKKDEIKVDENIIGKCLQCKKSYSGRLCSTSNWQRHLKVSIVLITGNWLNKFISYCK